MLRGGDASAGQSFNRRIGQRIAAEGNASRGGSTALRRECHTHRCALPSGERQRKRNSAQTELWIAGACDETVTLEPLALSVAVKLLLWPTVMLPKSSVVGDNSNWPDAVAEPESAIVRLEFEASDTMAMLPLAVPEDVGAKTVLKV